MDYKRITTYFSPAKLNLKPAISLGCVGTGLFLTMYLIKSTDIPIWLYLVFPVQMLAMSFIFLVVCLMQYKSKLQRQIGDEEYDAEIGNHLGRIRNQAIRTLGIQQGNHGEMESIALGGYEFVGTTTIRRGEDSRWRSNLYHCAILFFSQSGIYWYSHQFCMTAKNTEESHEYIKYQDIMSVTTSESAVEISGESIETYSFGILAQDGRKLTVPIQNTVRDRTAVKDIRIRISQRQKETVQT